MNNWHRKYTRGRFNEYGSRHRFSEGFGKFLRGFWSVVVWLFIFVVGSLIVSAILYPSVASDLKETFVDAKDSTFEFFTETFETEEEVEQENSGVGESTESSLSSNCKRDYDKYSKIGESKYSIKYKMIASEKIYDSQELRDFYKLYSGYYSESLVPEFSVYPIYVIATTRSDADGMKLPLIISCDHNGEITEKSRDELIVSFSF